MESTIKQETNENHLKDEENSQVKEEPENEKTTIDAQAEGSDDDEGPKPWYVWFCRGLTAFIVIGGTIFVIVRRDITRAILEWFVTWLSVHRWIGPIVLCLIYVVAQAAMIPGFALVLGAGFGLMKAYDSFW